MTIRNRGAYRKQIASLLADSITVADVDNHQSELDGRSPVVRVMSAGSNRPDVESSGYYSQFRFVLQAWVLAEPQSGYTLADAEDVLDDVEAEIASWVENSQNIPEWWAGIQYSTFSNVSKVKIGGEMWLTEDVMITLETY